MGSLEQDQWRPYVADQSIGLAQSAVLLVADSPCEPWLGKALQQANFSVEVTGVGTELQKKSCESYSLIILDCAIETVMALSESYRNAGGTLPVLLLKRDRCVDTKIAALHSGVDDCVEPPFHIDEFIARTRALLRARRGSYYRRIVAGSLTVDLVEGQVFRNGLRIHLFPMEWNLLEYLLKHPNQLFSAEELLKCVWQCGKFVSPDTVRTHVKTLRHKIDVKSEKSLITTVRGRGYRVDLHSGRS